MRNSVRLSCYLALFAVSAVAAAADHRAAPPPPLPPAAADEKQAPLPSLDLEAIEPEITITTKGTEIHEEYRYNGQLYMVKVKPAKGPPYYLIYDERGNMRRSDIEPDIIAPSWVIKRF